MKYKFLDKSGLQIVINQIENLFTPKNRKIANIDLQDDISAEELAANLNEYIINKDGKSAYEIAVDNGFVGSEQLWLESLKGDNGTDYILTDIDKTEIANIVMNEYDSSIMAILGGNENVLE